ncbi:MAG TPA: SpoIIE family protein phosphatase [Solirubrobacteraceae bacterium]|jgi:serine phosphatase RsbU (regulator of sigma subunit)/anti-sigma regulatory factor (Ser/Thr protein kinase)
MAVSERAIRRVVWRRSRREEGDDAAAAPALEPQASPVATPETAAFEIAPNDPLVAYFQGSVGAVDIGALDLESAALERLRAEGVTLVVPLIANGELIGLLNVGRRLSDQDFSADDRRLLETLAAQAAPAVRVGQLVRERQAELRERDRLEQELAVAQLIQQNFLPKELPLREGWQVAAYYRAARAVGGDFYDFIELPDGRLGLVIGDVTDKGVPAAMVMAATRSVLRASAQRLIEPGDVLARVNDNLCPDIPENMFVTCFYGVLDPATGHLRYANAGHNLPLVHAGGDSGDLRATGMPLGLLPGMVYEERETTLAEGATVLLYSDGLIEAHDSAREMFGTERATPLLRHDLESAAVIDGLLAALDGFIGSELEQEDDITLVVLRRASGQSAAAKPIAEIGATAEAAPRLEGVLADFTIASAPGNEREAMRRVAEASAQAALEPERLERLKTAAAEATMNAMEHGNGYQDGVDVRVLVSARAGELVVAITDSGAAPQTAAPAATPDIDAKLEGRQSPRGWGLFLIERMVDDVRQSSGPGGHTVELVMHLEGGPDGQRDT